MSAKQPKGESPAGKNRAKPSASKRAAPKKSLSKNASSKNASSKNASSKNASSKNASSKRSASKRIQILFLHSAGPQGPHQGSSDLVSYLKKGLGPEYAFTAPRPPRPEAPDYPRWKAALAEALKGMTGEVIAIGHSLGGSVLLKYLSEEKVKIKIAALCLAATPYWGEKGWEYEMFYLKDGFADSLPAIPKIFLYHSRKDDVVAFGHVKRYAEALPGATVRALQGDSHAFEAGLPELLQDLKRA
jgi:predicted alpha/beta hydrolase family esterase